MKMLLDYFRKSDITLTASAILLVGLGLLSICSSSAGQADFLNFKKQIVFFVLGLALMIVVSLFDYRLLKNDPYMVFLFYALCCLALFGLFFFAPAIRGVRSWYRIGPIHIDPIELTKIILIILLAQYFSKRHVELYRIKHIIVSGLYVLLPGIMIFRQPNLGSVLILVSIWLIVLLVSGIRLKSFMILMICGLFLIGISWQILLEGYQKERISGFLFPQSEPLGIGWNYNQAKIAIGSGGLLGKGFNQGPQTQYGFLPEPQNDFIFSAIAEEFGLVGVAILFGLFALLIWRIMKIAFLAQTNFSRLFAAGFCALLVSQFFVNIGMNLGLAPIIGISLPFVSYGGSGLLSVFMGLGILQSINRYYT
jgi:rod shape determining protein RodA